MRVTNNMMLRNTTSNINNNKYSVNSLNNQMSSQKKISRPSEDPVVAIRALRLRSNLSIMRRISRMQMRGLMRQKLRWRI